MLRGLVIALFAMLICGLPQISQAGPEGGKATGSAAYKDGEPGSTNAAQTASTTTPLRCRQTWTVAGANNGQWVAVPPNGGGGDNEQCRLFGSACSLYSWRTTHPVGWTPEDDGKSTLEWLVHGIQLIRDGALEIGGELTDAELESVVYEVSWIQEGE